MSKFIGVKMVEAVPMTAGQAANKGYRTPVAEKYSDLENEGYEVTYPDGYKSWCPKDVFESSYFGLVENNDGTKILKEDVEAFIGNVDVMTVGDKTTVVNAHTLTGFDMVRHSSCVDPKNYSQELGKKYAMEEVVDNLWAHLGFVLQWAKYGLNKPNKDEDYITRMLAEQEALGDKITKLRMFIANNPIFNTLPETKKTLMVKQLTAMDEYFHILEERIKEESVSK